MRATKRILKRRELVRIDATVTGKLAATICSCRYATICMISLDQTPLFSR